MENCGLARLVLEWAKADMEIAKSGWDGGKHEEAWDRAKSMMVDAARDIFERHETEIRRMDPGYVASCLTEYQKWRKGEGKYAPSDNPEAVEPPPFTPKELTVIEDAAVAHLMDYKRAIERGEVKNDSVH